jgi:hypothetical protein
MRFTTVVEQRIKWRVTVEAESAAEAQALVAAKLDAPAPADGLVLDSGKVRATVKGLTYAARPLRRLPTYRGVRS